MVRNEPAAPILDDNSTESTSMLMPLVTAAVAVIVIAMSQYAADAPIVVAPVVVNPLMPVIVALS
jgi:hypothetical protein